MCISGTGSELTPVDIGTAGAVVAFVKGATIGVLSLGLEIIDA